MSDWTYEMLRYAFSWNEESADKALKYVVNSRSGTESMSEFQLLDILLLTILTEKDEVERTSALIFLEEHGSALVFDYTRLHKVYFVLDNILGSPIDGQSMTYSLKSQVLVTYTALLIQFDCFETDVARFEGFVDLLYSVAKHTNKSSDRILRAYACECLHELESWYPGLLFPLLGEDWRVVSLGDPVPQASSVGQSTLGKFVNDELLHVHESYSRLFFTTFQHFTEQVVQQALRHQPPEDAADALSIAATPLSTTPPTSMPGTPPMTPRGHAERPGRAGGSAGLGPGPRAGAPGPGSLAAGAASLGPGMGASSGGEVFHFRIPENCHAGPEVAFDLAPDQTPPRLPRKLVRTMTRSISLVLETMPTSSSWTKIFFAERLSLFIRVLALPCRVVFHHFSPLLHASRPSLLHAFLVVTSLFSRDIELSVSEAVVERLFALAQDTAVEPCFRLLAINWLIALSTKASTFELLWDRVQDLCPKWHDPLELKEMKLQALLYCFQISRRLPRNLLVVLEALSEFKYCCRPVGAHAVVFRFLLRVVIGFAPEMERLEVPQCLCDLLRSHPRLLPSVLSVERHTISDAVQYKLLHSLGDFVSRLEPPSRIQCYFGLLVTLSQTPWLDPNYVMTALRRLVFCPSASLSWPVGMRVLITCRRVILSHPQAVIYQPMLRLLHHLATYQGCVDLRDRALLYLRLLTNVGSASLGTLLHPNPADVERMTQMLTPVLPKTLRLVGGPVPFLRLFKSTDERRRLGLLDRQCAVFVLPEGGASVPPPADPAQAREGGLPCASAPGGAVVAAATAAGDGDTDPDVGLDGSRWEVRWGDSSDDHRCSVEWLDLARGLGDGHTAKTGDQVSWLLQEYRRQVQACPPSIRLPFVLEYRDVPKMTSEALDWLDCPDQLFSLELTFSSSEHFVPIQPIRIPFIAKEGGALAGRHAGGFPCMNRLLLRLQPISPVPTSFGVNIAFNDSHGHMYFGQLETFNAAFQDLFLPVRLPLVFWSHLFESLWQGSLEEVCWSVKVLDLDREVVQELIRSQLGPFVVPSTVRLPEEDFDFEQEEYFERWNALPMADGDAATAPVVDEEEEVVLNVETVCTIVFIPPCYHLLMRFAISSHSTIVRVLTDRFQLLSYMDSFFMSWSRDAAILSETGAASKC
uniref:Adaptor-related protein complex 5 beta subunit n=1 Tax=Alexandrium monilatum TaxID=311494 RepID=A0A7S4RBY2_9DINO